MPQTVLFQIHPSYTPPPLSQQIKLIKLWSVAGVMLMVINNDGSDPVYSLRDLTTHKPSVGVSYAPCAMCCVQHSYRITSAALLGIYHGPSAFVNKETKPCQIKTFPEIHNHEVVEFTFRPLFPDVSLYAVLPPEGFPIHFSPLSN